MPFIKFVKTASHHITVSCIGAMLLSGGGVANAEDTNSAAYSISGALDSVMLEGVQLTLTGGATTVTDATGNYTFSGLQNSSYTITPSRLNRKFYPASRTVSISNTNIDNTNFTEIGILNDTGVTSDQCYGAGSDKLIDCRSAAAIALSNTQDGMIGRDANPLTNDSKDGKLGFSFAAIPGGCVQDKITGLMWEVKTADGGLRDWRNTYSNFDKATVPQKKLEVPEGETGPSRGLYENPTQADIDTPTNSIGFVNAVNSQALCGFNDWRMPTHEELKTILDYGTTGLSSSVDVTAFPNTQPDIYWTASANGGHPQNARGVSFGTACSTDLYRRSVHRYVRLVRSFTKPSDKGYRLTKKSNPQLHAAL